MLRSVYTGAEHAVTGDAVVLVTSRLPNESLYLETLDRRAGWGAQGLKSVRVVGDALSPGSIASAVWDGRRFAEDLGRDGPEETLKRNVPELA